MVAACPRSAPNLVPAAFALLLAWGCGGGAGTGSTGPPGGGAAAPPSAPELPREVREGMEVVRRIAQAAREWDLDTARSVADPEVGSWYWADPGETPVPCSWLDPFGDEDPFDQENQQCLDAHLLEHIGPTLEASFAAWGVNRGRYEVPPEDAIGDAPPWGSFDTRADMARLREWSDLAHASRSVQAAIDGQPITLSYRAEHGRRSVTVYMSTRAEAPYVVHVIADTHYGGAR